MANGRIANAKQGLGMSTWKIATDGKGNVRLMQGGKGLYSLTSTYSLINKLVTSTRKKLSLFRVSKFDSAPGIHKGP